MSSVKNCDKCIHFEVCGRLLRTRPMMVEALEILETPGALGHLQSSAQNFIALNCTKYLVMLDSRRTR